MTNFQDITKRFRYINGGRKEKVENVEELAEMFAGSYRFCPDSMTPCSKFESCKDCWFNYLSSERED